jgi:hypothetical protein
MRKVSRADIYRKSDALLSQGKRPAASENPTWYEDLPPSEYLHEIKNYLQPEGEENGHEEKAAGR